MTQKPQEISKNLADRALLPSGFVDVLPPDASQEARAITSLMDLFHGYGYERVKAPLIEFEETLLGEGPGNALVQETFRLMDPVSHRMLGLRSDSTPQIGRLASSRLASQPRPLRLTYANDVVRIRASQDRGARQFTQVGCEIIGDQDTQHQIEIAVLAVQGLKKIGVADITIDLSLPRLLDLLLAHCRVTQDEASFIQDAVRKRERDAFKGQKVKIAKLLYGLMDLQNTPGDTLKQLSKISDRQVKALCADLDEILNGVHGAIDALGFDDVQITLDVFEDKGFEYHGGIAFTLFAKNIRGELGRGGSYSLGAQNNDETAAGFTLYMDTVRSGFKNKAPEKMLCVSADLPWDEMQTLQAQGWRLWRGDVKNAPGTCSHVLHDGDINEFENKS